VRLGAPQQWQAAETGCTFAKQAEGRRDQGQGHEQGQGNGGRGGQAHRGQERDPDDRHPAQRGDDAQRGEDHRAARRAGRAAGGVLGGAVLQQVGAEQGSDDRQAGCYQRAERQTQDDQRDGDADGLGVVAVGCLGVDRAAELHLHPGVAGGGDGRIQLVHP
jgi:hypothetical protein